MNVNNINPVNFKGSIRETASGNQWERSNDGKKYLPLIGLAGTATGFALDPASFKPIIQWTKKNKAFALISGGIFIAASLGVGAIFDAIINKARRNDADKFAKTGKIPNETNKAKKIMGSIGLGIGAIGLLTKGKSIASKALGLVITTGFWITEGAIIDHGVNKFRDKLSIKAQKADVAEAKLENKIENIIENKIEDKVEEKLTEAIAEES